MDRRLDGIFVRIKRNGKFEPVCLSDMTHEELVEFLDSKEASGRIEWIKGACVILAQTLRAVGDKFDIVSGE